MPNSELLAADPPIAIADERPASLDAQFQRWFRNSQVIDPQGLPLVVYHGTIDEFLTFDRQRTADGLFWFTSDAEKIKRGEAGASGRNIIMRVLLSAQKLAGWEEYDRYTIDELIQLGFDGLQLDDDYVVFEPSQIHLIGHDIQTEQQRARP